MSLVISLSIWLQMTLPINANANASIEQLSVPSSTTAAREPAHYYAYRVQAPDGQTITLDELISRVAIADVVLVGEWHTHPAVHRFQFELLQGMHQREPLLTLSMEHFSRDHQATLNQYLAGKMGEAPFMHQTQAWDNYASDYRPLIEYAKTHQIPVVAANAPNQIVRCIAQFGIAYQERLPLNERRWIAKHVDTEDSPYKTRFVKLMYYGDREFTNRQYAAQKTWDDTMAESIVEHLNQHPTQTVLHLAGAFHVEQGQGIAATITQLNPELNIVLISPSNPRLDQQIGYQLHVLEPPTRFLPSDDLGAHYHHANQYSAFSHQCYEDVSSSSNSTSH